MDAEYRYGNGLAEWCQAWTVSALSRRFAHLGRHGRGKDPSSRFGTRAERNHLRVNGGRRPPHSGCASAATASQQLGVRTEGLESGGRWDAAEGHLEGVQPAPFPTDLAFAGEAWSCCMTIAAGDGGQRSQALAARATAARPVLFAQRRLGRGLLGPRASPPRTSLSSRSLSTRAENPTPRSGTAALTCASSTADPAPQRAEPGSAAVRSSEGRGTEAIPQFPCTSSNQSRSPP